MTNDPIRIRETTQPALSGQLIGVSNIWERDLPDEHGVVASRLSADVSVFDPASRTARRQEVYAGSVLAVGADRYCVVEVEGGKSAPGSITLRRISD
jgi:hypothetical protein